MAALILTARSDMSVSGKPVILDMELIEYLYDEGLTPKRISERFDCDEKTIRNGLKAIGKKTRPSGYYLKMKMGMYKI
jgi:hypothetical protein